MVWQSYLIHKQDPAYTLTSSVERLPLVRGRLVSVAKRGAQSWRGQWGE